MSTTRFMELLRAARGKELLIGGHRGHRSQTRENTLENFAEAKALGVQYIEIDAQLSRDGVAVIFHDRELSERTPLHGTVRQHTVAEMRAAFELCTLEEAMAWCGEQAMPLLLEIKSREYDAPARALLAEQIIQALAMHRFQAGCIPLSSDHDILRQLKRAMPELDIALIVPAAPPDPLALMRGMGASIYLSYLADLSPALVDMLHGAGYFVDGSLVNTREALAKAREYRVDLIESDVPEMLLQDIKGEFA